MSKKPLSEQGKGLLTFIAEMRHWTEEEQAGMHKFAESVRANRGHTRTEWLQARVKHLELILSFVDLEEQKRAAIAAREYCLEEE